MRKSRREGHWPRVGQEWLSIVLTGIWTGGWRCENWGGGIGVWFENWGGAEKLRSRIDERGGLNSKEGFWDGRDWP